MKKYEITFVVSENYTEDRAADIAKDVKKLVESQGGKVEKEVFWGKRKLIYKIAKNSFGYYYVFVFDIKPDKTNKLNKELNLNEKILRYLIVDFIEGSPFFEEGAREKEKEGDKKDLEEMMERKPRKTFKRKEIKEEIQKRNLRKEIKNTEEIVGAQDLAPEQEVVETEEKEIQERNLRKEIKEIKKEKPVEEEMPERKQERKQMTQEERKEQLEKKLAELLKDEEL